MPFCASVHIVEYTYSGTIRSDPSRREATGITRSTRSKAHEKSLLRRANLLPPFLTRSLVPVLLSLPALPSSIYCREQTESHERQEEREKRGELQPPKRTAMRTKKFRLHRLETRENQGQRLLQYGCSKAIRGELFFSLSFGRYLFHYHCSRNPVHAGHRRASQYPQEAKPGVIRCKRSFDNSGFDSARLLLVELPRRKPCSPL